MKDMKYATGLMIAFAVLYVLMSMFNPSPTDAKWNTVTLRDETSLVTPHEPWAVAETCTSADAEATALAVGERTYVLIAAAVTAAGDTTTGDGEIEFYMIPAWANGLRFRAIGITDDGTYTVNIRAGTLGVGEDIGAVGSNDSDTALVGTLAFVIGTQTSANDSSYELADAVTVTPSDWPAFWESTSPDANTVAEAEIDTMGADFIAVIPTTCSADAKLLVKGY